MPSANWPSELVHDLALAFRHLRRNPAFAAVAILTLALGVGANTAVFSVVDAVLLRPLPFAEPERLVLIRQHRQGVDGPSFETTYPEYRAWRDASRTFAGLAAVPSTVQPQVWTDEAGSGGESVAAALASGSLFAVLGAQAMIGRTLAPDDDRLGAAPVVVLGHGVWERRFGGDREILGRGVSIGGRSYTVVGVMPREFEYPRGAEAWLPLLPAIDSLANNAQIGFLNVVGRLAAGATAPAARQELDAIRARTAAAVGMPPEARTAVVLASLEEELLGSTRPGMLVLLGAAALVLLVACANVANLLLVRGAAREGELAVRSALGAGRGRLARHFLAEALVLAIAGTAVGLVACVAARDALTALVPPDLYRGGTVGIDTRVLLFTAGVMIGTALLFGIIPALRAARLDPGDALRGGAQRATGGRRGRRAQRLIVVAEVALAVVLLAGGGVLLRSFARLSAVPLGFDRERTLTAELFVPEGKYDDPARVRAFIRDVVARLEAVPGVSAAGAVLLRPLQGPDGFDYPLTLEGQAPETQRSQPLVNYEAITPGYFRAMGIPLLGGRGFTAADDEQSPQVVIVSAATAERFWPNESPIGKRLKWGPPSSPAPWAEVVGVVGAARYRGLHDVTLDAYVPYAQSPWQLNHIVVRAAGDPAALTPSLRAALAEVDPGARAVQVATVDELARTTLRRPRFQALLVGAFAAVALALGAVGIYGVVSFATTRRMRELGVRAALGARAGDLRSLVVRETLRTVGIGLLAGLALTFAAGRVLRSLLYEVSPADPATLIVVAAMVAAAALVAALVPARRAARVDPVRVLRAD